MWWKDIVNRLAHGVLPMPWHTSIIWRCEECGGAVFRVLSWDEWTEAGDIRNWRFALNCAGCGAVEVCMVVSITTW